MSETPEVPKATARAGVVEFGAESFKAAKNELGKLTRFNRLRLGIAAAFLAHAILTVVIVSFFWNPVELTAWFRSGFPSNVVMVKTKNLRNLETAEVNLDGRYRLVAKKLEPGTNGFQIEDFRDGGNVPPPATYRPVRLEIKADGKSYVANVGDAQAPAGDAQ